MAYIDKIVVNGAEVDSSKPIYYHPIYANDNANFRFQFVILDNNATAYTWDTCKAYIKALMDLGAIINCNGWILHNSNKVVCYMIFKSSTNYVLLAVDDYYIDIDSLTVTEFKDGVNRIN